LDLTDKYPSVKIREEALALQPESPVKNKNEKSQMKENEVNETALQQWTVFFKKELSKLNEKLAALEEGKSGNQSGEVKLIKQYVEKIRKIQEDHLNWSADIAKSVNEVATYADTLAEKSNKHYKLTEKVINTVDENAKVLNYTQDWVGNNAKITNAIAETVDHNAEMLNGINEWNAQIAKGVNELHEWGGEKAKAINGIHEWTSSIAKNLNQTANWSEDMFGRAMSKEDAKKLIQYVELVSESKKDPKLRKKLDEALSKHGITGKPLTESMITGIKGVSGLGVITDVKTVGNSKVDVGTTKASGISPDERGAIIAKLKSGKFSKSSKPKQLKTLDQDQKDTSGSLKAGSKPRGIMVLDTTKSGSKPMVKISGDGPTSNYAKAQALKLNAKPEGSLKESLSRVNVLKVRSSKLDEKLSKIISSIEQEKRVDESVKTDFPFTALLSESDRKSFAELSLSDKKKISEEIKKNPTTDAGVIKALWENVLATEAVKKASKEPLWLAAAPKEYRAIFESSNEVQKAAISARAEFYTLNTQYQIENFWQTSGLNPKKEKTSLNEVFSIKNPKEADRKLNSYVAGIGEMMKKYQG
jgi:predicted transcriptional regulator